MNLPYWMWPFNRNRQLEQSKPLYEQMIDAREELLTERLEINLVETDDIKLRQYIDGVQIIDKLVTSFLEGELKLFSSESDPNRKLLEELVAFNMNELCTTVGWDRFNVLASSSSELMLRLNRLNIRTITVLPPKFIEAYKCNLYEALMLLYPSDNAIRIIASAEHSYPWVWLLPYIQDRY